MAETIWMVFLLLLVAPAVIYAHREIPARTKGRSRIAVTRALLGVVGVGFGLTWAAAVADPLFKVLNFLIAFGIVHVPAAIILFIKSRRGVGKT